MKYIGITELLSPAAMLSALLSSLSKLQASSFNPQYVLATVSKAAFKRLETKISKTFKYLSIRALTYSA